VQSSRIGTPRALEARGGTLSSSGRDFSRTHACILFIGLTHHTLISPSGIYYLVISLARPTSCISTPLRPLHLPLSNRSRKYSRVCVQAS